MYHLKSVKVFSNSSVKGVFAVNIKKISKNLNKDGLRVVAVCQKKNINNIETFSVKDEAQMSLVGFIGFLDPPKESAKVAIEKLNNARY